MTTKRILTFFGIAAGLTCLVIACSEEFLDGPPQGVLDQNTLANQFGVEANLIAAYSILDGRANFGGWGAAGSNWIFGSVASDDAYKGSEPGDQQPASDVELYQWSTGGADGYLNDKWSMVYEGISRANATLTLLNRVQENNPEEVSADDADRIAGEAKFLRAHYHFEAWKFWGRIPYYTEADVDFRKANLELGQVIPLIIADLDDAISLLPESQGDVGRVNSWTAKAYKGKVLVYNEQWSEAKAVLDDVVNNGPYALQDCFHDIFSVAGENGTESILAYQSSSNDGDAGGNNANYADRLNHPHSGSPFGCCGFHQPSQNLVNAFRVDANGLPLFDSFNNNEGSPAADQPVDPRLDWTVGRDGVPFLDWGLHEAGWIRDRPWAGEYSPKKNIYEQASGARHTSGGWNNTHLSALNIQIYRYSELLLLLAEAEVELGNNLDRARELVNLVRTRAANCAQGPVGGPVEVAIDDPAITWATYDVGTYDAAWTDQQAAREAVRFELRLETAMEGHRFFNLRRWGIAKEVLNDYIAVEETRRNYLTGASPYEDRHDLYPLPTVQIELSEVDGEDRLIQNPGW